MSDPPELRVLFLGDSNVGKTSFLRYLSKSSPPLNSLTPIHFDVQFSNRPYRLIAHSSSHSDDWKSLDPKVLVLCYDISSRLSLIHIQRFWSKEIHTVFASRSNLPILLVGLKRDLRSEEDPNGVIYPQEAYRIAQELRCDGYLECSAETGELMKEVFEDICRVAAKTATGPGAASEGGCVIM